MARKRFTGDDFGGQEQVWLLPLLFCLYLGALFIQSSFWERNELETFK